MFINGIFCHQLEVRCPYKDCGATVSRETPLNSDRVPALMKNKAVLCECHQCKRPFAITLEKVEAQFRSFVDLSDVLKQEAYQ